jgi:hypothetical protein
VDYLLSGVVLIVSLSLFGECALSKRPPGKILPVLEKGSLCNVCVMHTRSLWHSIDVGRTLLVLARLLKSLWVFLLSMTS